MARNNFCRRRRLRPRPELRKVNVKLPRSSWSPFTRQQFSSLPVVPPSPFTPLKFHPAKLVGLTRPGIYKFWKEFSSRIQEWNRAHSLHVIARTVYEDQVMNCWTAAVAIRQQVSHRISERQEHQLSPWMSEDRRIFHSSRLFLWRGEDLEKEWALFNALSVLPPLVIDLSGSYGHVRVYNPLSRLKHMSKDPNRAVFKLSLSQVSFRISIFTWPHVSTKIARNGKLVIGHRIRFSSKEIQKFSMSKVPIGSTGVYLIKVYIETKTGGIRERVNFLTPDFGRAEDAEISCRPRTGYCLGHPGYEILDIVQKTPPKNPFQPVRIVPKFCLKESKRAQWSPVDQSTTPEGAGVGSPRVLNCLTPPLSKSPEVLESI